MKNRKIKNISIIFGIVLALYSCDANSQQSNKILDIDKPMDKKVELATLGAGCFWCVEAVFQELKGVYNVESGYTGGTVKNPTYAQIGTGQTGHAEVAQITYDPEAISFETILSVFFQTHDPTTLNQQGADRGTQYRSAVFYHNAGQKNAAETIIKELNKENVYPNPIVTEVTALGDYYPAEDYHQNYFSLNPDKQYCAFVIQPKVDKFRKVFKEYLK